MRLIARLEVRGAAHDAHDVAVLPVERLDPRWRFPINRDRKVPKLRQPGEFGTGEARETVKEESIDGD